MDADCDGSSVEVHDIAARLNILRRRRRRDDLSLRDIKDVIVIASSPRAGSTFLAGALKAVDGLLHLSGEMTPHLALANLSSWSSGRGSDFLDASDVARAGDLIDQLMADVGAPVHYGAELDEDQVVLDVEWRLTLQWPMVEIASSDIRRWTLRALPRRNSRRGWTHATTMTFHNRLMHDVIGACPSINPYYYDLPPGAVLAEWPFATAPMGPPGNTIIEPPPFILHAPWRHAIPDDLRAKPLILKTPSNAYRLNFLRELFSGARLRIIHLVRHPGATINGIFEAWHHHGFFTGRVDRNLRIDGYSDVYNWGDRWWKFDQPPGWRDHAASDLWSVCAFQWAAANRSIIDYCRNTGTETLRVTFEELLDPQLREHRFQDIGEWLGLSPRATNSLANVHVPPLVATVRDQPNRWLSRKREITRVLKDADVNDLCIALGYRPL